MVDFTQKNDLRFILYMLISFVLIGCGISATNKTEVVHAQGVVLSVTTTDKNSSVPLYHVLVKNDKTNKTDTLLSTNDIMSTYSKGKHVKLTYNKSSYFGRNFGKELETVNGHE